MQQKKYWQCAILLPLVFCFTLLSGCSFFEKNPKKVLPPVNVPAQIQVKPVWSASVGDGTAGQYLLLAPYITDGKIIAVDAKGHVYAYKLSNGQLIWSVKLKNTLTSGPAVADGHVYLGTGDARLVVLSAANGKYLWSKPLTDQVLATPGVAPGVVIVKTIDGQVTAFNSANGQKLWNYGLGIPTLILRGGSMPKIVGQNVVVGFANGKLTVLNLANGNMVWQRTIAMPQGLSAVQQMVDIDANPIVANGTIYVTTYQGSLVAAGLDSGQLLWQHDMSAYSGMALTSNALFVTDAGGHIWSFNPSNGLVQWRQNRLVDREITGPAIVGNYLVVGDNQGNLYFLSQRDGNLVAKVQPEKAAFYTNPIGRGNRVYALNRKGKLYVYQTP